MKARFAAAVVILIASSVLLAQTPPPQTKTHDSKARQSKTVASIAPSKALMQEVWNAWSTLDVNNAAKFYAHDGPFPFYDIAPFKYNNWQQYEQGAKQLLATFKSLKATVQDDAVIRSEGRGALGTATVHLDIVGQDGKSAPMDLRWTVVWEHRGGQWLIIHEQISAPLPTGGPQQTE